MWRFQLASKDISLALVEHLDLLKANGTDYLLVTLEPGKNADRADVWYELKDKDSPKNLLEACLSLFTNIYEKEDLIDVLFTFCEELDNAAGIDEETMDSINEMLRKKKRKNGPE